MRSKCYAVLDTNVLVSALLGASRMSIPTLVLKAVTEGHLSPFGKFRYMFLRHVGKGTLNGLCSQVHNGSFEFQLRYDCKYR